MRIDIVSDVVCPWCFIGKRRLERAVELRPDVTFEISWRPFQLNPDMPREGMERQHYLSSKFGSPANAERIYEQILEAGEGESIAFAFDRIARTPNTIDAHRMIRFAGGHGVQDKVVEIIFRRYFEEAVDTSGDDWLVDCAEEAGIDRSAARDFLGSGLGADAVRDEDLHARGVGISGVPCFIIDRRLAVSGAQAPEVFLRVFETAEQAGNDD